MSAERIDIDALVGSLDLAEVVSRYVQIRKAGDEYEALCPFHQDTHPSFRIIPKKGFCYCHACQWHGDMIAFVMDITGCKFREAIQTLQSEVPVAPNAPKAVRARIPVEKITEWDAIVPVPPDAPEFDPGVVWNPKREKWAAFREPTIFDYRNTEGQLVGYVLRIVTNDGKITPQITYCKSSETGESRWCLHAMPRPRPLYGAQELSIRPDDKVIVTEGESCRDAARDLWPGMLSVSWCGGTAGAKHTDWSPLYGRDVVLWPDNDAPGVMVMDEIAAELHAHGATVRIVEVPGTNKAKGWDIVDALKEDEKDSVKGWVKRRLAAWTPPPPEPPEPLIEEYSPALPPVVDDQPPMAPAVAPVPEPVHEYEPESEAESEAEPPVASVTSIKSARKKRKEDLSAPTLKVYSWSELQLAHEDGRPPHCNEYNVSQVLNLHEEYAGKIWYDEFYQSIFTTVGDGEPREWTEQMTMRLVMWLQGSLHMHKVREVHVINALKGVAMANRQHKLRDWLNSLVWDDVPRLESFLHDAFGTALTEYTAAVGRCWLMAMVARVLWPGCQSDYMVVLEGVEGIRKSSALNALAAPYFAECDESIHNSKVFAEHLQGAWLIEMAEMHSFCNKSADVLKVKGTISRRDDRYREPWAKQVSSHPRQCVFAGTTNQDDWNKSDTGARRFWPIRCGNINDEYIRLNRHLIFAEAVAKFKMFPCEERYNDARAQTKADWWMVPPKLAQYEQESRRDMDEWQALIIGWLNENFKTKITVAEILSDYFGMHQSEMDKAKQMRVASALRSARWEKTREGNTIYWQRPSKFDRSPDL